MAFLWYLQNIFEQIVAVLTIFCFCVFYKGENVANFYFYAKFAYLFIGLKSKYAIKGDKL